MKNSSNEKVSPKHIFLHLFVIIMLYAATINFLALVFQYINVWIPDPLSETEYYAYNQYFNIIRFALSFFIVVFPVFILTSWFLNKSYKRNPAVFDMKTRKWLIYFTLFAASLIIIADLVSIIFTFLEGEITLRFILKALSVLLVAGTIFGYYLWDVKREKKFRHHKNFVWTITAIALIAILAGFFIIGSPQKERLRRFDQERINNLSDIQWQIIEYWRKKEQLPESLDNLKDEISGYQAPTDPQTNEPYEYNKKGELSFELCAVFSLEGKEKALISEKRITTPSREQNWNWQHSVGRICFERTIDPELYPPYSKENLPKPKPKPID